MPGPQPTHDPTLFTAAAPPAAELGEPERIACLRLIRCENVGPVTFRDLVSHFGSAEAALAAVPELSRRGGRPMRVCSREAAVAELERARAAGAEPLFAIEPGYPAALAALDAPPPLLYVKGVRALLNRPVVAIVGSRQCSAAGAKLARHFAGELGAGGLCRCVGVGARHRCHGARSRP